MIKVDRNILRYLLSSVPYHEWSPLFLRPMEVKRFERWCLESQNAQRIARCVLAEQQAGEWGSSAEEQRLSVGCEEAETIMRRLVVVYEDLVLKHLFRNW